EINRCPFLMVYSRTIGQSLTRRSLSGAGGHIARVRASGPKSSRFGPRDFHVPCPRLPSVRTVTVPSFPEATVYFALSTGDRVGPPRPTKCASRQVVPARFFVVFFGGVWADALPISSPIRAATARERVLRQLERTLPMMPSRVALVQKSSGG